MYTHTRLQWLFSLKKVKMKITMMTSTTIIITAIIIITKVFVITIISITITITIKNTIISTIIINRIQDLKL